jgi:uncharacterized protein YjbI with pentapeptide repeats
VIAATAVTLAAGVPAAVAARSAGTCQPGSGPHLAGQTLTAAQVSKYSTGQLRCANLTGATLSGLSLIQVDLTGTLLQNANLQHTDLTQATLDGANFSHANLSNATLDQASAHGADFQSANLSGASLTQTDLTGANLDGTKLSGTGFTQATLDRATFAGATGVFPWSLILLLAAIVIFALLALPALISTLSSGGRRRRPLGAVLIGSLLAAAGFHLFAGGLISEFVGGFGTPVQQTCSGPLCAVGVASGFVGLFGGIVLLLVGFGVRGWSGRRRQAGMAPGFR